MLSTPLARASLRASRRDLPSLARPFTSTPAHNLRAKGPVPIFPDPETFSPDLSALISKLKSELVIPAHLSRKFRHIVYSKSMHKYLRGEEPYTLRLKGQEWTLEPRDKQESFGGVKALTEALNLMETEEEYMAVLPILLAWKQSDRARNLGLPRFEMVLRKLRNAGQVNVLNRIVNEAEDVGFKFTRLGVRWTALAYWENVQDAQPKVGNKAFKRVLRLQEALQELAETDSEVLVEKDLAKDPVLNGLVLGTRAKHCINLHEGNDKDGRVAELAETFLKSMEGVDPKKDRLPDYSVSKAHHDITIAEEWQAVFDGIKCALKVIGKNPKLKQGLEREAKRIENAVEGWAGSESDSD